MIDSSTNLPKPSESAKASLRRSKFRVFISYPRNRFTEVSEIVNVLKEAGLDPIWDQNLSAGQGFQEQIQYYIAHSHVFSPIITKESSGWVHQEIGYALALNIPVLPICLDREPGEMLSRLQAVFWTDSMDEMRDRMSWHIFNAIVKRAQRETPPLYEAAPDHDQRTRTMAVYATRVYEMGRLEMVRQKGGLSSFHIPDKPVHDPTWGKRFGIKPKSQTHCSLLRQERISLGRHAEEKGCKLVVDPYLTYERYGLEARITRLKELLRYLKAHIQDTRVQVVIHKNMSTSHSLTVVGDWFVAESVSAEIGKGYRQTIFTRHAPTINNRIELFDEEFDALLMKKEIRAVDSIKHAVEEIDAIIQELECARKLGKLFYNSTLENGSNCKQYNKEHSKWEILSLSEKDLFYQMAVGTLSKLWDQSYHLIGSKAEICDKGLNVKESPKDKHLGICPHLLTHPKAISLVNQLTANDIQHLTALFNKIGIEIVKR